MPPNSEEIYNLLIGSVQQRIMGPSSLTLPLSNSFFMAFGHSESKAKTIPVAKRGHGQELERDKQPRSRVMVKQQWFADILLVCSKPPSKQDATDFAGGLGGELAGLHRAELRVFHNLQEQFDTSIVEKGLKSVKYSSFGLKLSSVDTADDGCMRCTFKANSGGVKDQGHLVIVVINVFSTTWARSMSEAEIGAPGGAHISRGKARAQVFLQIPVC
jgi:hypothetical protein